MILNFMMYKPCYFTDTPIALTPGADSYTVTGLGLTFTPKVCNPCVLGDGTAGVGVIGIQNLTADGFTVYFNTQVPNDNFTLSFWLI